MSDWKIEAIKADPENIRTHDLLVSFLECNRAWKRLSKKQREVVEAAYPDGVVKGHWATHAALERHGFVAWDNAAQACVLTPAAREVFRWVGKP